MTRPIDPCAMCARFTIQGYDQQAAAGMGRCTAWDNPGEPIKFVRHDAPPCVLFLRRKAEPTNQRKGRA